MKMFKWWSFTIVSFGCHEVTQAKQCSPVANHGLSAPVAGEAAPMPNAVTFTCTRNIEGKRATGQLSVAATYHPTSARIDFAFIGNDPACSFARSAYFPAESKTATTEARHICAGSRHSPFSFRCALNVEVETILPYGTNPYGFGSTVTTQWNGQQESQTIAFSVMGPVNWPDSTTTCQQLPTLYGTSNDMTFSIADCILQ